MGRQMFEKFEQSERVKHKVTTTVERYVGGCLVGYPLRQGLNVLGVKIEVF